ncbi:MAG: NAD(P)/FAD-dependent oxidoreductase [Kofleriaceae bacterium]|jgi:NADH dehydrogenase|nr:NAD(P)/FAD-dependent oxidoreductase [Kofleriaceae bacterium]MBP9167764.1 NAD(P)/FAD-dependent oxidoreductase [Kofleriaceae bacterium]MBP9857739.1 NAD(P)/FAD-dependent oxidoreductase [Kofleriaceae bacterium]
MTIPHVVILGGGFGGLTAAQALADAAVQITLVDRRNHHLFQPLLYQVATAALNPSDIAYPIRAVLARQANARVLLAEATAIDPVARTVTLDDGVLGYDYLIVATGATHSYFGHDAWATHAPGLKSIEDALEIRRRVFVAYEAAEREQDPDAQRAWLRFVVVGAGPTGVELAGALGEIGLHTLAKDFRTIDPRQVEVLLVEGNPQVLGSFPAELGAAAAKALAKRRVTVRCDTTVVAVDGEGVEVAHRDGRRERIAARTVLWAAGVKASPLAASLGVPLDRAGRVEVDEDLAIPGRREVFVVGDLAARRCDGKPVPGVCQGAIQGGRHVAAMIRADLAGRPRRAFRYRDKGSLATIGRAEAVAWIGSSTRHGFFAWLLWWVIHIYYLVGFKNRFFVMLSWAWSWLTFQRGARLITGEVGALPAIRGLDAGGRATLPAAATTVAPPDVP